MAVVKQMVGVVVLLIATCSLAHAQSRHIVDPLTITGVVVDHAAAQEADRAALRTALTRPEVRAVASHMGLDVDQMEERAQALSGAELNDAANRARQLNDSLVGGASTIVISTTAIIIVLLIVLILVAL